MDFGEMVVPSPKRVRRRQTGWDAFFPYYAGFPSGFASKIIDSANLPTGASVYDPWNGSGTTTFAAIAQNYDAVGVDLNPAMVVIARARLVRAVDVDSIIPLSREIFSQADPNSEGPAWEPLSQWFDQPTAQAIRALETNIRKLLVGEFVTAKLSGRLDRISPVASLFYVALFAVCRSFAVKFRSTNPTWIKCARQAEDKISVSCDLLLASISRVVDLIANDIDAMPCRCETRNIELYVGDSTERNVPEATIDFVLTSPPYCTRIDYTSATRIELAVIDPLLELGISDLSRKMLGSVKIPTSEIVIKDQWGPTCLDFIERATNHVSRASAGYYRKTHLDYFNKLDKSLEAISASLKDGGRAILVVQDSYYKDIHNDLAAMASEMASNHSLRLRRREDFKLASTIGASHRYASKYDKPKGATKSVLCFIKS